MRQEWTLDQAGNWDLFKSDLNGDGSWGGAHEMQDARTHNVANELIDRNTDNTGGVEHTLVYTAAGQLADDDQHYQYVYDAFGRLVKILNQEDDTVTEYRYNGLGHRIGHRWDSDADEDLEWEWLAYDDKWRIMARFEDGADVSEPFEQLYHHHAGLAGYGGSSYIDPVTRRDQLEYVEETPIPTREYILQNWRADVVALTSSTGDLLERITYDPYGIPFATHPTDLTHGATSATAGYGTPSGVVNNDDYHYFLTLYGLGDWRADWNRDGVVDTDDHTAFYAQWAAATGSWGRGVLSNRGNILGYAGYVHEPATGAAGGGHGTMWHVRHRVLHSGLGRWIQRDPIEYVDGPNLYAYGMGSPIAKVDWTGGACVDSGCISIPHLKPPHIKPSPILVFGPCVATGRYDLCVACCHHLFGGLSDCYQACWDSFYTKGPRPPSPPQATCDDACEPPDVLGKVICVGGGAMGWTVSFCICEQNILSAAGGSAFLANALIDCVRRHEFTNVQVRECDSGGVPRYRGGALCDSYLNEIYAYEVERSCIRAINCPPGDNVCQARREDMIRHIDRKIDELTTLLAACRDVMPGEEPSIYPPYP